MYQFAETQDSRIAHYSFGSAITSHGLTVFSCTDAREGKKIFGNDPDPTKEVPLDTIPDVLQEHIDNNPDGIVAKNEDCLLYTSPSPRDVEESRMPSSA